MCRLVWLEIKAYPVSMLLRNFLLRRGPCGLIYSVCCMQAMQALLYNDSSLLSNPVLPADFIFDLLCQELIRWGVAHGHLENSHALPNMKTAAQVSSLNVPSLSSHQLKSNKASIRETNKKLC